MNTIYFRVDASDKQGEGHLRRCLTIASSMTLNVNIVFCCASLTLSSEELLINSNFTIVKLDKNESVQKDQMITLLNNSSTSTLIIDNYEIDKNWESDVRNKTNVYLIVIDDLADRKHYCDLLVDSNYFRIINDYAPLVNNECEVLCGIQYLIFSEKVLHSAYNVKSGITKKVKNTTHVFFGSTDPHINSAAIGLHLAKVHNQKIFVALTKSSSQLAIQRQKLLSDSNISITMDESQFSNIMSSCEFAIGAPGVTLWERLLLGCKTGCFATNENQVAILKRLQEEGVCCYLGPIWEMSHQDINESIKHFYELGVKKLNLKFFDAQFNDISESLLNQKIMNSFSQLKSMKLEDVSLVSYSNEHIAKTINWLSSSQLRATFGFSKEITPKSHRIWLLQQHDFYLWAIYSGKQYVGNISIRISQDKQSGVLEIYLGESTVKGQGIGNKCMEMIIDWSFKLMGLRHIQLITIEGNVIAEKLYKNSGFIFAGTKEKGQIIDGTYVNHNKWLLTNKQINKSINRIK